MHVGVSLYKEACGNDLFLAYMRTKSQQGCDGSRKTEVDVGLPFTLMKDGDDDNSTGGEGSKWRFFWQREGTQIYSIVENTNLQ